MMMVYRTIAVLALLGACGKAAEPRTALRLTASVTGASTSTNVRVITFVLTNVGEATEHVDIDCPVWRLSVRDAQGTERPIFVFCTLLPHPPEELDVGESYSYQLHWSGQVEPTVAGGGTELPPGDYQLIARYVHSSGTIEAPPIPYVRR
jgi:hypothetical protein